MRQKNKKPPSGLTHRHVYLFIAALILLVLFLLSPLFSVSLILLSLIALEMLIKLKFQWLEIFGFEIGYFLTMMMGFLNGPRAGFLFGIGFVLLYWVYTLHRDPNIMSLLSVTVMVPLMGLVAGFFPLGPFVLIGMALTLMFVVAFNLFDYVIRHEVNPMAFVSPFGQLALNYVLFTTVSSMLLPG